MTLLTIFHTKIVEYSCTIQLFFLNLQSITSNFNLYLSFSKVFVGNQSAKIGSLFYWFLKTGACRDVRHAPVNIESFYLII